MNCVLPEAPDRLIDTAERLRAVRTASQRFLILWAMTGRESSNGKSADFSGDPESYLRALKKSGTFDWSCLYESLDCDD